MAGERNRDMSENMSEARAKAQKLIKEVERVVVGKHSETLILLSAVFSGGHVLIEDVPGTGKTTLAATVAKAAGLTFRRAQFTPDVMASDITGFNIYNRAKESFEFREGFVMCNVFLADEINRASPKTQSALLEAMEERRVTVDGVTYEIPAPFAVIATQNPSGYVGTFPLPEAQLDRFAVRISMGYPTEEEELSIILDRRDRNPLDSVSAVITPSDTEQIIDAVRNVEMASEVSRYIVSLVQATRKSPLISLGASPRATLALMRVSKAFAFLRGQDYVTPEDVGAVFKSVVSHRITAGQEARLERLSNDEILDRVAREVSVPYRRADNTYERR